MQRKIKRIGDLMKGSRAKPIKGAFLASALVLAQAGAFLIAQDSGAWTFSMGSGLELMYGTAYEYVYDNSNTLSELDWDIKPLVAIASEARAKSGNFGFSVSCAAGFPGKVGTMADSDWQNEGTTAPNVKTNYSESDAILEHMTDLLVSLDYDFPVSPTLNLKSSVGFRYLNIAWQAKDGWLQYADNITSTSSPPYHSYTTGAVYNLYGLVSTYEQSYSGLVLGFSADWKLSTALSLEAGLQASPVLSATAVDNHVLRGLSFTDTMSGGYLLQPELSLRWLLRDAFDLAAHLKYTWISGLRGDETVKAASNYTGTGLNPGDSLTYSNSAGAAFHALGLALTADWHL